MTTFNAPSEDLVREALRRIPSFQLRRAFYEGLKNPLWLEPLAREGVFRNPPSRITTDDGSTGDPYWPEIEYLVRVAKDAPSTAVDILIGLQGSDNAWVRRALFAVGAAVPASEAARLKPVLKAWIATGFGWRSDPREMVAFALNLITGGQRKTGEWVANALFRPGSHADSLKPDLVLEEYWYEAGLPEVVHALGPGGLRLVLGWLVEYEKAAGQLDGWLFSRPRIRERRDEHPDVEAALIDATRDLAIECMKTAPAETVSKLVGTDLMITRRIAMHATTAALSKLDPGDDDSVELLAAAEQLLFDAKAKDERCRVEFGELAREIARHSSTALDPLVDFVAAGPELGAEELRSRMRRDEEASEAETDKRVAEYVERWEHLWLASVGAAALPVVLATRLADLDERLGVIDEPLSPPFSITSWSGPNSPITQVEMAAMSPEELVAHLESWHDLGAGYGPEPSHEGQARELTGFLTSTPSAIAHVDSLVSRLRPTYLRAIMRAWEAAYKAALDLDWEQVIATVRAVLRHGNELDFPREGGDMDDDPDFTGAKQAAVGLLDELVKKTEPARVPIEYLSEFANLLIDVADDEAAWSAYVAEDRETGADALTLSLNWQWPILIRGLAALVGHGPSVAWSERARETIQREIGRRDPRGASRAVVGENLGRFLNADELWATAQIPGWFGTAEGIDRGQQIALSTAIEIHHYHRILYELLAPAMESALRLDQEIAIGWQHHGSTPSQRIGEWAIKAVIFGHVDWTDRVVSMFFSDVDPAVRGAALGRVAWEFMHSSTVDDDIRDRFASVLDSRLDHVASNPADALELREFYWVVKSGKFDATWWLPRLKRVLELAPGVASERFLIGKEIATAADVDPRAALDVTRLLLTSRMSQDLPSFELSRNAVPMVIARALELGDESTSADATAFMNELGEAGNLDLAKQVRDILNGVVTQQDVDE